MAQPKASTLQQRFGFQDDDLKNPNHDEIMMWLDMRAETIVKLVWKKYLDANFSHRDSELPPPSEIRKIWEFAITGKNGFMIGFIDMMVVISKPFSQSFCFEVKSVLPSLGELIRQVRMYQTYINNSPFYIVAPDDRYAKQLEQQGIGFIKYPEGTIFGQG
jgi:hypothetical protein